MLWRQLECFIAVGRHLNYTEAAKDLFLSQSVVSYHINNLEKDLGLKLLYRTSHTVQLTPYGREFFERLLPHVDSINEVVRRFDKTSGDYNLHISSTYIINYKIFAPSFNTLRKRHPNITIHTIQMDRETAIQRLLDDVIEGCFCFEDEALQYSQLKFYPLFQIRNNGYLVPASDPLAGKESITYEDLIGKTIILPKNIEQQHRLRFFYDNIMKRKRHLSILYAEDMLSAFSMVSRGLGISPSMDFMPAASDNVRLLYNSEDKISRSGFCINMAGSSFYARELAVLLESMYADGPQ
ncbi:MAG: LysR family transcriptional regulator [Mogibacterium sp.]|nr:LysR family transcriptional regulator [Mogibacterium sp.]